MRRPDSSILFERDVIGRVPVFRGGNELESWREAVDYAYDLVP